MADQTDQHDQHEQTTKPSGDPETMDRGQLIAELTKLDIPFDPSASEDGLRASVRRAPDTLKERQAAEEAAEQA